MQSQGNRLMLIGKRSNETDSHLLHAACGSQIAARVVRAPLVVVASGAKVLPRLEVVPTTAAAPLVAPTTARKRSRRLPLAASTAAVATPATR